MIPAPSPVEVPATKATTFASQGLGNCHIDVNRTTGTVKVFLRGFNCNKDAWAPIGYGDEFTVRDALAEYGSDAEAGPLVARVQNDLRDLFALLVKRRREDEAKKLAEAEAKK